MKKILMCILLLFCMISCREEAFFPQEGDLLFIAAESSVMSDAIVDATQRKESSVQFDHVAFVLMQNGSLCVAEASPSKGVCISQYGDFIQENAGRVVVKRLNVDFSMVDVHRRLEDFLGEDYDWYYLPDNGRMYCSELLYETYRKPDGSPLFTARPMKFRDADGVMPAFWTELFAKLGRSVPEGVPGTNPNDLFHESILDEVYRNVSLENLAR